MVLAAEAAQLRSRFAPMPPALHIIFCAVATVTFLAIYLRKKTLSSIIWLLICDATLILQLFGDSLTAAAVGICEIVLFIVLWKVSRDEKKSARASENPPDDGREDIAKLVKAERKKINADGSDDVISNAFEDDKL